MSDLEKYLILEQSHEQLLSLIQKADGNTQLTD